MTKSLAGYNNYIDIYEAALNEWAKPNHDTGMELLEESLRLARIEGDRFFANKVLNEIEIRQKKVHLESKLRSVHITLTDRCNTKCQFCYLNRFSSRWDMPAKICEDIITYFPYLQQITWQGGEAFLHPNFKEMVTEAIGYPNIQQTLITNGSFLNKEWLELFFKIRKFYIVISLESVKKEVYEDLRRGANFDKLINNLKLIKELRKESSNVLLSMNVIIMKRNYLEIEEILDFAIENEFCHLILTPLYENSSEFYRKEYLSPGQEGMKEYFSGLMPKVAEKAARNKVYLDDRFSGIGKESSVLKERPIASGAPGQAFCFTPWQQLFLESTGEVKSHCSCSCSLGNLKDNSISQIWNGGTLKQLRQYILNQDYHSCSQICVKGMLDGDNLKLL